MKLQLINILKAVPVLIVTFLAASCSGDFDDNLVKDNLPAIPVTYDGATTAGFNPYYAVPYQGGNATITITMKIPETSKVKIKEVTKVIAGITGINAGGLTSQDPAIVLPSYITSPIASSDGYSVTLTTSLSEFNTKVPTSGSNKANITTAPAAGAFTERAFMFLLTMEDDSQIIPMQCRIRVTP